MNVTYIFHLSWLSAPTFLYFCNALLLHEGFLYPDYMIIINTLKVWISAHYFLFKKQLMFRMVSSLWFFFHGHMALILYSDIFRDILYS